MAQIMLSLGWNATELLENGNFEHLYRSPVEMQLDTLRPKYLNESAQGRSSE